MKKRIFSLLMVVCMLASLLPAGVLTASAAEPEATAVVNGVSLAITNENREAYATTDDTGAVTLATEVPADNYVKLAYDQNGVPTLYLKNATVIAETGNAIDFSNTAAAVNVVVEAASTVTATAGVAVLHSNALAVYGPGKLTVNASSHGIQTTSGNITVGYYWGWVWK